MHFSTTRVSSTHTYPGVSEINFFLDDHDTLAVTIDTERLHMRSVEATTEDYDCYASLFGDPEVMGKYATGQTKNREDTEARIKDVWVKRWHQNDPYSGLAVFKNDTDEFVGNVTMGYGDEPGNSELAYLFKTNHWGKGYATEAVTSVVKEYAPATIKEGYLLKDVPLNKITATARPDNPCSIRILEKIGMHKIGEEEKYGALRHHFSISI